MAAHCAPLSLGKSKRQDLVFFYVFQTTMINKQSSQAYKIGGIWRYLHSKNITRKSFKSSTIRNQPFFMGEDAQLI